MLNGCLDDCTRRDCVTWTAKRKAVVGWPGMMHTRRRCQVTLRLGKRQIIRKTKQKADLASGHLAALFRSELGRVRRPPLWLCPGSDSWSLGTELFHGPQSFRKSSHSKKNKTIEASTTHKVERLHKSWNGEKIYRKTVFQKNIARLRKRCFLTSHVILLCTFTRQLDVHPNCCHV